MLINMKKLKHLGVRVEEEFYTRIEKAAQREGRSTANFVRYVLSQWVDLHSEVPKPQKRAMGSHK